MWKSEFLGVLLTLLPAVALAQSDSPIKPNDGTVVHTFRSSNCC